MSGGNKRKSPTDIGSEMKSKRSKSMQKYREAYMQLWGCLKPSKKGETFVFCDICKSDFSCAHAGKNDCKRHVESKQHVEWKKIKASNVSMLAFCVQPRQDSHDLAITKAEVEMCEFLVEHNLPLSSSKPMVQSMQKMFPDSKIASGMRCARNKATAIIHDLADITQKSLTDRMKDGPYTLSTDGSNDNISKQFPIVVRTIDPATLTVNSELLSIAICETSATGENIFGLMDRELRSRNIPWSNCLSLGCDNASVMTGHKKGVYAFVKEQQPQLYLSGCPLHLIHIAARKASESLPAIDDLLVDIFYFFNKSDNRKLAFKGTQDLYDVEQKRMLKHVCTRWLSIGRPLQGVLISIVSCDNTHFMCLERLLHNWDPLKVYFKSQKDLQDSKKKSSHPKTDATKSATSKGNAKSATSKDNVQFEKVYMEPSYAEKKIESVYSFVRSPTNRLYVLFLNYTVKVFDDILTSLQAEDPRIYKLIRSLHKLVRNILVRFVKPSALMSKSVDQVQYNVKYNQKTDSNLVVGQAATEMIKQQSEHNLKDRRIKEFYGNVRLYFVTACDYMMKKLPLNDPVLVHAEVADVALQLSSTQSCLLFFADRFPCLLSGETKDTILQEFVQYQTQDVSTCLSDRMDNTWKEIGKLRDEEGNLMFGKLASVMLGILTIPHSSAHCERVFSCVRKNRTEQRSSLKDKTVESLMILKSRSGQPTDRDHSRETLVRLKGAYYRSLRD